MPQLNMFSFFYIALTALIMLITSFQFDPIIYPSTK